MGMGSPARQTGAGRPIAAFDFDGTLTVQDSFMDFLKWRAGPARFALGLVQLGPSSLAYVGHRDRGRLKVRAVRVFLRGTPRAELAQAATDYCDAVWGRMMRPDALATWEDWKAKGVTAAIVTASPEDIVAPFAARLGADVLLGTRLAYDDDDRVAGAFVGENCRALEKVVRLRAAFGDDVRLAAAYGDTSGDTEMLEIAEEKGFRRFVARPG